MKFCSAANKICLQWTELTGKVLTQYSAVQSIFADI